MLKKSLLWLWRLTLWLSTAALAAMLICALTIQFWVMPNISRYKDDIAAFASKAANQKIQISHIKADWQDLHPRLTLNNIAIFDAQNRVALQLGQTEVLLSWLSIPMLEPYLAKLSIYAPQLTVRRLANGEIFVAGISMSGESKPDLINWLIKQNTVEIKQAKIIWLDEKRNAPALSLDNFQLTLDSPLWRGLVQNHAFTLSAEPSSGTRQPITIRGDFYGNDISNTADWHGNLHLQLRDTDLTAYKTWLDYPIDIQSGMGRGDVNIEFAEHHLTSVNSEISLQNLQLQTEPTHRPVRLQSVSGSLGWKNLARKQFLVGSSDTQGYSISLDKLFAKADNGLNIKNLQADYTASNTGKSLKLQADELNIASMNEYAELLPANTPLRQHLMSAEPHGVFNKLELEWQADLTHTLSYRVQTAFNQLSMLPHDKIPGFSNMAGEMKATQKNGQLVLNSLKSTVDFKDILRWPIPIDSLKGKISWNTQGTTTKFDVSGLNISNSHLSGTVNANYVMDGIKGGMLDLKGKFDHGNAKYALFYYPISLGEATLHWLDTSILSGNARNINLVIKGRLDDFPYVTDRNALDNDKGLFRVTADLSDILLEYGTGWPVIEHLNTHLLFEGKRMELNASAGQIFGNRIVKSKTTIAQLDADSPILNIDAEVVGPVSEGIHFVNKSPVLEVTQGFTDGLITSGNGKLNLSLTIPMQNLEASKYKGVYQISNGRMESPSIPALTQINGNLEFTESSLNAKNIKALVFDSPLAFNLSSGKDKAIRVAARGRVNDDQLKQLLRSQNLGKLSGYIYGSSDWTGSIFIQKPRANISIRSDLNGITSQLPAPLNKSSGQSMNLRIDKRQDGTSETILIGLGNKLQARLGRSIQDNKAKLQYADIRFNPDSAANAYSESGTDSRQPGISLSGKLDYLNADAWLHTIKNITDNSKTSVPFTIKKTALSIDALDIFERRINQLKISNLGNKDGMQARVESREISGDLQWVSQNNGKLIARLSNFTIPEAAPDRIAAIKDSPADSSQFTKQDQDYPGLDIFADNFIFDKKNFGSLELVAFPQGENWNIQKLKIASPDGVISAEGQWNNWIRSPNTSLNVNWDIRDLGKTLQRFNYPDTVKDGSGQLKGRLSWPGSPSQFDTTRLNGELDFDVRKGQILQVKPGVGRLLGLVSLQSLPRRLTLDFRDLFANGFAFDKITANVKINQGIMRSDNFVMTGPAADVEIKGETNLQKETQHLYVKVLPRISDSISLAALAGGPLAGAVAFLAQKVLKDPLNKIVSTEYEIIGTWDNPQEVKKNDDDNKQQGNGLISPMK